MEIFFVIFQPGKVGKNIFGLLVWKKENNFPDLIL